ncbi:cytochrome P450 [Sphingomonas sp. SRS2]|uniref:cytochrome P450 n=1 Tax=Sphingomonas sp. SRS2 TaxID=133190 RepID=UPI00061841D1|nr:cytochrome P450 [Sphingomonas sp. SRS2]KKC26650.1 hypothetical protein WP12_06780 [Sphingomonas sp. SRS2]
MSQHTPKWLSEIDPVEFERALTDDPYPYWARLREEAPVAWVPSMQMWMVTRWREVRAVAMDRKSFHGACDPAHMRLFGENNVLSAEGAVHAEIRSFVDPHLRKNKVSTYVDDLVRPTARRLLESLKSRRKADIVAEYLEPVSVRALGDYLGLRDVPSAQLMRWFHGLGTALVNKGMDEHGNFLAPEAQQHADVIKAEIRATVDPILDRVRRTPDDSGLSHWVNEATPPGQPRSNDFIYPTLFVTILGGMQEPGHGAANTLLGLFSRPDQFEEVRADWSLIELANHEGYRWISPIGVFTRRVMKDTEVGGVLIPEGAIVAGSMASANRDPEQFPDGDVYDLRRPPKSHIAFNMGAHSCAGRYFGSAVQRIALEELFAAFPGLAQDKDADPTVSGWFFRATVGLPVVW